MLSSHSLALICIFVNVVIYIIQSDLIDEYPPFSVANGGVNNMIYSMFYHDNLAHLMGNMLCIYSTSLSLFRSTDSQLWRWGLVFFIVYFSAGFGGFYANVMLNEYYGKQWELKIDRMESNFRCSHWLCDFTVNTISRPIATGTTFLWFGQEYAAKLVHSVSYRIGASGGGCGLVGARVYTGFFSKHHSNMGYFECFTTAMFFLFELADSDLTLEDLAKNIRNRSVDHIAHVSSLIIGFVIAALLCQYDQRVKRKVQKDLSE